MNYLVCVKQVPGTSNVEIDEATGVLKRSTASAKLNPFDLFGLETAFKLREQYGGNVHVLSMGPPQAIDILKETICMGADKATLLSDRKFAGADVLATSYALSQRIMSSDISYDIIICGKQTTDGDTAQVGPEIAEMLGLPHASNVQEARLSNDLLQVSLNLDHCEQIQTMELPCLITIEKDVNTPRLPSYKRKKEVSDDEILVVSLDDLPDTDEKHYGLSGSPTQVERIFPPDKKASKQLFEGTSDRLADEIVRLLVDKKFV